MASSSADIAVAAMATALSCNRALTPKELETICLSVEPTDAAFYPGITQFDYINGSICNFLGTCPPLKILILMKVVLLILSLLINKKIYPTKYRRKSLSLENH